MRAKPQAAELARRPTPGEPSMRWRDLIRPLALAVALVITTSAFAITPETETERSETRQAIAQQLSPAHSYALLIGISEYDNDVASDVGVLAEGKLPNGYSVHELISALTSFAAQHVFLFFDSCFSGAMLPEPTRANDTILASKPVLALSKETAAWTLDLLAHNARLVLTAGNASQTVPDVANPFATAVVDALGGAADTDGDGLILGTEIAQFVRARVARATRLAGHANDPVFAVLPKLVAPVTPRPDASDAGRIDYALQGDFIFLSPDGPKPAA